MHLKTLQRKSNSRRAVYSEVDYSKIYTAGVEYSRSIFTYVIIPNDYDRDKFINRFYQTGELIVVTLDHSVMRNVKVPTHLIDDIVFPESSDGYGSLLAVTSIIFSDQYFVTGIFMKPGIIYLSNENTLRKINQRLGVTHTRSLNYISGSVIETVINEETEKGGFAFRASSGAGRTSLQLLSNGDVSLEASNNIKIDLENNLKIEVGIDDKGKTILLEIDREKGVHLNVFDQSIISITDEEMILESKTIKIGSKEADQPIVLGNEIKGVLSDILSAIQKMTVNVSGVPSTPPTNIAEFNKISLDLKGILSKDHFVE